MKGKKRKNVGHTVANPHYLSIDRPAADPIAALPTVQVTGRTVILDVHEKSRSLVISETNRWTESRSKQLYFIRGAQPLSRPAAGGFDTLFAQHKSIFNPEYGSVDDIYEVFRVWAFCQGIRSLLHVRPIALFTGPPGATKSTTISAVAKLWFGNAPTAMPNKVPDNLRDFVGTLVNNPIVILDNVESAPKWLADTLCIVSSGDGKLSVRELYTTAGLFEAVADTFVAISSFSTQAFTRGDLLARSLIFRLRPPDQYQDDEIWREAIEECRTGFWQEAVTCIQAVLKASAVGKVKTAPGPLGFDRLQNFIWIGRVIADHFGGPSAVVKFDRGMAAMSLNRLVAAVGDPQIEMLVNLALSFVPGQEPWFTSTELLHSCARLDPENHKGFDLTTRSASAFGKWVSDMATMAPGTLTIDRKLLDGRTRWRIRLPNALRNAAGVLTAPVSVAVTTRDDPAADQTYQNGSNGVCHSAPDQSGFQVEI